jgi:uncharacterized protein (TIRG00374 family)
MSRKHVLATLVVIVILGVLFYLQFRSWQTFDWGVFWMQTRRASLGRILFAVLLVYCGYVIRALRWKIFLRPVRPARTRDLLPAMVIGFAGLALLGRPAELIRPYLVARRQQLPFSSQVAVWMVERIFDTGSFAVLVTLTIFFAPSLRSLPYFAQFTVFGYFLVFAVLGMIAAAFLLWRGSEGLAAWVERRFVRWAPHLAHTAADRARAFGRGLHTIHDLRSFFQLTGLSLLLWLMIALAYREIAHAYPEPLRSMTIPHVLLLMGFGIAGSTIQLPAVGGGTQLANIAALAHIFGAPPELAVSCGIMLWLVTFVAIAPAGFLLARREHLSLRQLEAKAEAEARGTEG